MSKKIELCKVRQGETFTLDGVYFVKLDDDKDAVFALTAGISFVSVEGSEGDEFMTLKELRSAKHLTTKMAASLCGISYQHYNFIECGKRRPSVEVAKKIAEAFGFDWTRFYEEE